MSNEMTKRANQYLDLLREDLEILDKVNAGEPDIGSAIWGAIYEMQITTIEYLLGEADEVPELPPYIREKADGLDTSEGRD